MVNNQLTISERDFIESFSQQVGNISGQLDDFESLDIIPHAITKKSGFSQNKTKVDYDFLLATSGASTTGISLNVAHRNIRVGPNNPADDPLEPAGNFFSNIGTGGLAFNVLPRLNLHGLVTYDVFFSFIVGAADDYKLTVITAKQPPGFFTPFVSTTNAPTFTRTVSRTFNGVTVYDFFILSPA